MGAQGTGSINFGAFPGASDATLVITGQTGIGAGSLVEAWILPAATADHSSDEHVVNPPRIVAGNIVGGTGFTIYGLNDDRVTGTEAPPGAANDGGIGGAGFANSVIGNNATYGLWAVAWVWS